MWGAMSGEMSKVDGMEPHVPRNRNSHSMLWGYFAGRSLRSDAASLCHVILFADCLIYLGPGIDQNRKIAVRIKAGCWNGNGREHSALGGLERCGRNVHGSSRGKPHAGNRRWSISLTLVLYDDSQLRRSCHVTIRIGTSKAPIRKGDEIWVLKRFLWRDASSGRKNPEAAVHGHSQMCSRF